MSVIIYTCSSSSFVLKTTGDKFILWQNPRTSSFRYCRSIWIQFKKERYEFAEEETSAVEEIIKKLEKNGDKFGGTKQCLICES